MIKNGNVRITITLDKDHIDKLNHLCSCLGTRNNQKAIYFLLDFVTTDVNLDNIFS